MVKLRRPPSTDKYGDKAAADPDDDVEIPGAFTAPRVSSDADDRGRQGVIVGLSLFGPYGSDIRSTDQIVVDGVVYDVDGDPGQWLHPGGWQAGFEVALKRAAG